MFFRRRYPDGDRAIFFLIFEVFAKFPWQDSISLIVRAPWHVREGESCALSKFQPPTTLGEPQNVEKTIRKYFDFLGSRKSIFADDTPYWRTVGAPVFPDPPHCFCLQRYGRRILRPKKIRLKIFTPVNFFVGRQIFRPGNFSADAFFHRFFSADTFFERNFFRSNIVSAENIFGRNHFRLISFRLKQFSDHKFFAWFFFSRKILWRKKCGCKIYRPIFFSAETFRPKIFLGRKQIRLKHFSGEKLFGQKLFRRKNMRPEIFSTDKFFGRKHFGQNFL